MTHKLTVLPVMLALASCATQKFDDALLYGRTRAVNAVNIHAAIIADNPGSSRNKRHVYEIEIVNKDKIRLYYAPRGHGLDECAEMTRTEGKWKQTGGWISVTE